VTTQIFRSLKHDFSPNFWAAGQRNDGYEYKSYVALRFHFGHWGKHRPKNLMDPIKRTPNQIYFFWANSIKILKQTFLSGLFKISAIEQ